MNRRLHMTMVSLATLMLLTVMLVPHHHHGRVVCVVVERCDGDGVDNDRHTEHHDDGSECVENEGLVLFKSDVQQMVVSKTTPLFAAAVFGQANVDCPTVNHVSCNGEGMASRLPAGQRWGNGLRAPPVCVL